MFLSVIGPTTYKLLASLIALDKQGDKNYEELVKVLKEHHNPTPSEIVKRYKFYTRIQQPGESTTQFVAELRALAQYCNFGASLTDLLRDCIVCRFNDNHVQRRLLSEKAFTFEKALKLAVSLKTAKKNVSELQGTATPQAVQRIANHTCYHCRKGGHQPDKSRFKQAKSSAVIRLAISKEFAELAKKQTKILQEKLEITNLSPSDNSLRKRRTLLNSC